MSQRYSDSGETLRFLHFSGLTEVGEGGGSLIPSRLFLGSYDFGHVGHPRLDSLAKLEYQGAIDDIFIGASVPDGSE